MFLDKMNKRCQVGFAIYNLRFKFKNFLVKVNKHDFLVSINILWFLEWANKGKKPEFSKNKIFYQKLTIKIIPFTFL